MLKIDLDGVRALLSLLRSVGEGGPVGDAELERVFDANAFFVDFYSGWEGSDRDAIAQAIRYFDRPERVALGWVPSRLAEGFRQALGELDLLESRISWLSQIDATGVAERVLAYLPPGTPLDATIHITVDQVNNAFAHGRGIGVSLLKGAADRKTFDDVVTHELHHVGFRFWSDQDPVRRRSSEHKTARAVAVLHVQNLLAEGMANYYCTPGYVFRASPGEPPADAYQARLARLQREEEALLAQAEAVLAMSLEHGAAYEPCSEAFKTIALDMEEFMLPAGHYLGARMVGTMAQVHPREAIVHCVRDLAAFLPLYNEAALKVGAYGFDAELVDGFSRLWDTG
jgi:hypothetical protein